MKIIINSDDFGASKEINSAIIKSFNNGLCTSATIMSNMVGFEEACWLAHENNLDKGSIGIHLVLTAGIPITEEIKRCKKFCDSSGGFLSEDTRKRQIVPFNLENNEKFALAKELRAQIERCIKNKLIINHLDSHQHVHTELGILNVVLPIANEYKIKGIRISRNCGKLDNLSIAKRIYKFYFNGKLSMLKKARTNYFGDINDYIHSKGNLKNVVNRSVEIMIHPQYNGDVLADLDGEELVNKLLGAGLIKLD